MAGPASSDSRFEIHLCWKVACKARIEDIEPPTHTECLRSGGTTILCSKNTDVCSKIPKINNIAHVNLVLTSSLWHLAREGRSHAACAPQCPETLRCLRKARYFLTFEHFLANIHVALHYRVEHRFINTNRIHSEERRLKTAPPGSENARCRLWSRVRLAACSSSRVTCWWRRWPSPIKIRAPRNRASP